MLSAAALFSLLGLALAASVPHYQFVEEWSMWKGQHQKTYENDLEELNSHVVWLSNKKYIEAHNQNAHVFGFTLAMNHFADLVSTRIKNLCIYIYIYIVTFVAVLL